VSARARKHSVLEDFQKARVISFFVDIVRRIFGNRKGILCHQSLCGKLKARRSSLES
jgi:hypothetical protein